MLFSSLRHSLFENTTLKSSLHIGTLDETGKKYAEFYTSPTFLADLRIEINVKLHFTVYYFTFRGTWSVDRKLFVRAPVRVIIDYYLIRGHGYFISDRLFTCCHILLHHNEVVQINFIVLYISNTDKQL